MRGDRAKLVKRVVTRSRRVVTIPSSRFGMGEGALSLSTAHCRLGATANDTARWADGENAAKPDLVKAVEAPRDDPSHEGESQEQIVHTSQN